MTARHALIWCAAAASAAALAAPPAVARQVEHFIVLMQENHSFDNYFGTYPGADGIPEGTCMPAGARAWPCVRSFHLGGRAVPDVGHDLRMHRLQYARGRLDSFVRAASRDRQTPEPSVMGWYDRRDLPFYWNLAREYVLFDRFFASARGGSEPNHAYWIGGRPGAKGPTIFDRLDARGIAWKFYVEDLGPATQALRVPVLGRRRVVDLDEYYEDLRDGRLPQVAYIAPGGSSEHPPGRVQTGQALVRHLLTALWKSDAWDRSAFMWTYDNWGGWFDHVRPPRGRGFRVPALLVSPYARRGHVDSTVLETASIARFIEENWDLEPLPGRVREAAAFESAFDFSQAPRAPAIVPVSAEAAEEPAPRRWAIYLGYGFAALLGGALFGWVVLRPASRVHAFLAFLALALVPAVAFHAPPARAREPAAVPPVIQTVPATPGMRFSLGGVEFEAGSDGRAYPPLAVAGEDAELTALATRVDGETRATFDRWYRGRSIAAIELYHLMRPTFVDLEGRRVDPRAVATVTLRGSQGRVHVFIDDRPQWLQGNRVVPESQGTRSTTVYYSAEKVMVSGSSVVHRSQQRFFPAHDRSLRLRLLLFAARITVRDALLGFPIGSAVRLEYPNGRELRQELDPDARLTLGSLPRGDYRVSVEAPGIASSRPVALSRDQDVELRVVSWLDVAVVVLALASVALGLLFARRPATAATAMLLALTVALAAMPPEARAQSPPDPLLAYYYIWFNASSWDRAKTDYPLLGRYSSDDREVMRTHVEWAKNAGIDGFIVSWKSTPVLDRRLQRLAEIAAARRFRLLVIYQGLDFEREPLPAARVAADLDTFSERFGRREAFRLFRRPLVIWSGTWEFSRAELASVTGPRRERLLILASERNERDYRRVADLVDGNAYYWGSVNPATFPGYPQKLAEMGEAVHDRDGLWIAPAAPGFDARLVGGTEVVRRAGGATLRTQLDAAAGSSPDAVGLISWNEFSENTHIEPSRRHGMHYLRLVGEVRGAHVRPVRDFDSSEPAATGVSYGLPLLGAVALFLVGSVAMLIVRRRTA